MRRVPLTFRALVLLPLLAVLTDQTRAAVMCGPRAESCLEAAGQGWYAAAGLLAFALYGAGLALVVARLAGSAPGFRRLWAVATGAVWASCAAQAGVASLLGAGSAIGGGWLGLLALGVARGRRARAGAAGRPQADPGAAALRAAPASPSTRSPRDRSSARGWARAPPGCA